MRGKCGVEGAGGAVALASKVPPGVGGFGAWSIIKGTTEPYQSSERSLGEPVGSIHSSPPGRQTRVGARLLGSGCRERRKRRSASTNVVRRKRAARQARASMMGMQGPQGSGDHEPGSDAEGPSMYPGGCSGVEGTRRDRVRRGSTIWRERGREGPDRSGVRDRSGGWESGLRNRPSKGDPERTRGVRWRANQGGH